MKITIEDLLKLEPSNRTNYLPESVLSMVTDIYVDDRYEDEDIEIYEYDHSFDDGRSRKVCVIHYKGEPNMFYQYVGTGNYKNMGVIDDESLYNMILHLAKKEIDRNYDRWKIIGTDGTVDLENYNGQKFFIEDSKLKSR